MRKNIFFLRSGYKKWKKTCRNCLIGEVWYFLILFYFSRYREGWVPIPSPSLVVCSWQFYKYISEILTCFLKSSMCGPRVWGSASWTNRMTSSTDQEEASLPEPSLSCFKWSGPVVELAAVEAWGKRMENQIKLIPSTNIAPSAHDVIYSKMVTRHWVKNIFEICNIKAKLRLNFLSKVS